MAQAAAGRSAVQLHRRAARGPVRRHLALLHLAQLGRDAALKLHRQRRERVVGARLAGIGHHRTRQLCARGSVQVVEEALAPQAEHLRRAVVVPGAAHPVERCHEDAAPGGEHDVVRARRAPAALRLEQRADPRRARRGGERRALVPRPLGARRRVGAHLHELRRRVLAQALARARGAARVARGGVEGEPRLGGVAPTDARHPPPHFALAQAVASGMVTHGSWGTICQSRTTTGGSSTAPSASASWRPAPRGSPALDSGEF